MRTLTYFKSTNLTDRDAYSVRAKTKKEVLRILTDVCECKWDGSRFTNGEPNGEFDYGAARYSKIVKVTVEYADIYGLAFNAMSEGGLYEEEAEV